MHAVFMTFGVVSAWENFKIDLMAQKFKLKLRKEGQPDKFIYAQGRLCQGVFGIWEYCFPKEDMDAVLTTLGFHAEVAGTLKVKNRIGNLKIWTLRKMLKCEPIPEFKTEFKMPWITNDVSIIPIGVRYDEDITEPETSGEYAGYTHEGI